MDVSAASVASAVAPQNFEADPDTLDAVNATGPQDQGAPGQDSASGNGGISASSLKERLSGLDVSVGITAQIQEQTAAQAQPQAQTTAQPAQQTAQTTQQTTASPQPSANNQSGAGQGESWWGKASPWVHDALGAASFIPGVSAVTGVIDAGIYTAEGDYLDAGLSAASIIPGGKEVTTAAKVISKGVKAAEDVADAAKLTKEVANLKQTGNAAKKTYEAKDFISEHAYDRHGYDPSKPSTKNKTRYADNVDPNKIRQETIANPDKVEKLHDAQGNHYATKYSKDMGYNISQSPVNSSKSRVFVNHADPTKSTQFPYGK